MNELAQTFLDSYAAGAEPEGGWLYGKALQQARLDFTPDSLKRLDALLSQIRERAKPGRAELDTAAGRNFEALVVFYVMEFVRRMTHAMLAWHDRDSALAALPPGTPLEDTPATRLVVDAPALGALFKGAVGKDVVSRTWRKVKGDCEAWAQRDLSGGDVVRLILGGTVVRVRLDRRATSISLLVVLDVRGDGQKVPLAVRNMGGESEAAWRGVLDDLIARGLQTP